MYLFFLAGFFGGVLRGVVGVVKYTQAYKDVKMRYWYFLITVLVTGLIGLITAWIVKDLGITFLDIEILSPTIALIVGYAGGDFIENIFKILIKKANLYE